MTRSSSRSGQHAGDQVRASPKASANWIGGNCTVSCMLMGVGALYKAGLVEWMQTSTYQAASGGGRAQHARTLTQYGALYAEGVKDLLADPASAIRIDRKVTAKQRAFTPEETANFRGVPPGGNLIPWIDADRGDGTSLEEWKAAPRPTRSWVGKMFGTPEILIDSTQCASAHALPLQSLTFKLKKDVPSPTSRP